MPAWLLVSLQCQRKGSQVKQVSAGQVGTTLMHWCCAAGPRRVAVGDTLIDCASVLGGGRMLQLLVEPLLQLSKQVTSGAQFDWRTAEAALYCIRAVHRCAPLPGDALMVSLFGSLPQLPAEPLLQYTVALTVGAYSDWLADTAARSGQGRALLSQVGVDPGS